MKSLLLTTCLFALFLSGPVTAGDVNKKLSAAATGSHRAQSNIDRNAARHPVETLSWLGIREDMTVVEIAPGGGGWYTEILAPFLRDKGKFYAASYNNNSESDYLRGNAKKYLDKLAANPQIYDQVVVGKFEPPALSSLEPKGQADMVLTFRNTHNWLNNDTAAQVFSSMFEVLKSGGILGLVQHRGNDDMLGKEWSKKGYVSESEVIRLAEAAGFKLAGRSEINANPADTKDYADGVWTLPPVFRLKDLDRAKYAAIGESDRMTLKFVKP